MADIEALKKLAFDGHGGAECVKKAQASPGIWQGVKDAIEAARRKWENLDPGVKPLVGSLVGGGLGAGAGALAGKLFGFGAGRGALAGLGLGGIGGALYGSDSAVEQVASKKDRQIRRILNQASARKLRKAVEKGTVGKMPKNLNGLNKMMDEARSKDAQKDLATLKARFGMGSGPEQPLVRA